MKRIQYILAMAAVTVISSISAFGQQNLRTAYFLDGYTYNYKMNPAMAPERAFFAITYPRFDVTISPRPERFR